MSKMRTPPSIPMIIQEFRIKAPKLIPPVVLSPSNESAPRTAAFVFSMLAPVVGAEAAVSSADVRAAESGAPVNVGRAVPAVMGGRVYVEVNSVLKAAMRRASIASASTHAWSGSRICVGGEECECVVIADELSPRMRKTYTEELCLGFRKQRLEIILDSEVSNLRDIIAVVIQLVYVP